MAAYNRKRAEQMSFTDDLMFRYVMRDPERCRMVLERVVGLKDIGHIEVLETQRSIMAEIDARGVRLDAGQNYGELKDQIIIFFCTYQPYPRYGMCRYEFRSRCTEEPELELDDGIRRIVISSQGDYSGESGDVQAFLRYMNGELSDNSLVETLDRAVCRGRTSRKERLNAMIESPKITTMIREGVKEELRKAGPRWLQRGMRKGMRRGRTQGETCFAALARELRRDSRLDDLQRALDDRKYRYALYKEYGIL